MQMCSPAEAKTSLVVINEGGYRAAVEVGRVGVSMHAPRYSYPLVIILLLLLLPFIFGEL